MLLGGAAGEAYAHGGVGGGERTGAMLFVLEGLVRARSAGSSDPVPSALSGLQRWMHCRGVPWRDCVPDANAGDTTNWLAEREVLRGTSADDPAMLTGLARIAAGGKPGRNHANSATAVPLGALAALWHDDADAVFELATDLAGITHGHPNGNRPAGVLGVAAFWLLHGHELADSLDRALAHWASDPLTQALRLGRNRPSGFLPGRTQLDAMGGGRTGVEVLAIALRVASAVPDDFASAVRIAADHSGDAASSAVVCGQLLGALHGPSAIPGDWLAELAPRSLVERLAEEAIGEFGSHPETLGDDEPSTGPYRTGLDQTPRVAATRGRFVGSVLGCVIGEALGVPITGYGWDEIQARHGSRGLEHYVPAGHPPGRLGSDAQLLLFSLEGMIRANIARRSRMLTDPSRHLQHAYQRWLHTQHLSWGRAAGEFLATTPEPDGWLVQQRALFQTRNPGRTMMRTLIAFAKGQQAMGTPEQPVSDSRGSTAITRAVSAALWSDEPAQVFRIGMNTAALTHGHPDAVLSAGALAFLVSRVVHDDDLTAAVGDVLDELARHDGNAEVARTLSAAVRLAESGDAAPEALSTSMGSGWTAPQALGIGLHAALAAEGDFDRALRTAVNHSGNSATTGAVAGCLVGAVRGASEIPEHWLSGLELAEVIERLAQDAVQEFGPRPPQQPEWFERYPAT